MELRTFQLLFSVAAKNCKLCVRPDRGFSNTHSSPCLPSWCWWFRLGPHRKRVGLGGHLLGGLGSDLLCKAMDDGALPDIEQLDLSVNSIGELAVRPFGFCSGST